MNKIIISKQELLSAAKEIVFNDGLSGINIRKIASKCNVSVGSVYNYFPSKTDIIFAVIEDFWSDIPISNISCEKGFFNYYSELYNSLYDYLNKFKCNLLQQIMQLNAKDRQKGKQIERHYMQSLQNGLLEALNNDTAISPAIWTENFTKQQFAEFVFSNMMAMLRSGNKNPEFLKEVFTILLFREK